MIGQQPEFGPVLPTGDSSFVKGHTAKFETTFLPMSVTLNPLSGRERHAW